MRKIAFLGFPQGKVRLKVSQQETTIEDTIDLAPPVTTPPETGGSENTGGSGDLSGSGGTEGSDGSEGPILPPPPSRATLKISATRTTGPAPMGFFFSAKATGFDVEDHYHDVEYKWSFDDPGHYTRQDRDTIMHDRVYDVDGKRYIVRGPVVYLADGERRHAGRAVLAAGEGWRPDFGSRRTYLGPDRNIAHGPHAAHVFETPGAYTVTCEARKRGHAPVVQKMTVTVLDPDEVFAGKNTYVVSADGDFSGAPAGARTYRSWKDAISAANSGAGGTSRRILFKRGQRHSKNRDNPNGYHDRLHIGAFGSGRPPVIRSNGFLTRRNGCEFSIWGLDIEPSNYDPADPWGTSHGGTACIEKLNDCYVTVWDCKLAKMKNGILLGANNVHNLIVGNTYVTDWQYYGFFANFYAGEIGFCGFFVRQNVGAVLGTGKNETSPPFYVDHGPLRFSALGGPIALNLCDARSIGTWGAPNTFFQPNYRIGRSMSYSGPEFEEAIMDRCTGLFGGMYGTGNADSNWAKPRRFIWDKCYMIEQNEGSTVMKPSVHGTVVRNSVAIIANVKPATPGNRPMVWAARNPPEKGASDMAAMADFGTAIYCNTMIDQRSDTPMRWELDLMTKGGKAGGGTLLPAKFVHIGNNVIHSANRDDRTTSGDDDLDTTEVWKDDYPGVRFERGSLQGAYALPRGAIALYFPKKGAAPASRKHSNVGNGQGAPIAVRDFWGNLRGTETSRGAFD